MSRRTEVQVGITVVVALVALLWGVTWLKDLSLQRQVRVWHVRFPQTGGLGPSDEVQVNGMRKGAVSKVELVGDHVVVDLALDKDIRVTHQSVVAIRNVGLMGEKVIFVELHPTGRAYTARDTIPGIFELGMGEVMAQAGGELRMIPAPILQGIQAQSQQGTRGLGGDLAWPGLLRKLDRVDPSYKE